MTTFGVNLCTAWCLRAFSSETEATTRNNGGSVSQWGRQVGGLSGSQLRNRRDTMAWGFGSMGDTSAAAVTGNPAQWGPSSLQQGYLSKVRKGQKGQQQVPEESPQCERSRQRWRWNPLGCNARTHVLQSSSRQPRAGVTRRQLGPWFACGSVFPWTCPHQLQLV